MYGSGCFQLDWPATLALLLQQIGRADIVVPGHGRPVSRDFVVDQLADLAAVATLITELHAAGATVGQALAEPAAWPFPAEPLELAVTRAFASLDK